MYRSIVVPLDGSPFAEQAVATALPIAESSGAKVTLVRTWDPANFRYTSELTDPLVDDPAAHERLAAVEYLDGVASRLRWWVDRGRRQHGHESEGTRHPVLGRERRRLCHVKLTPGSVRAPRAVRAMREIAARTLPSGARRSA